MLAHASTFTDLQYPASALNLKILLPSRCQCQIEDNRYMVFEYILMLAASPDEVYVQPWLPGFGSSCGI